MSCHIFKLIINSGNFYTQVEFVRDFFSNKNRFHYVIEFYVEYEHKAIKYDDLSECGYLIQIYKNKLRTSSISRSRLKLG